MKNKKQKKQVAPPIALLENLQIHERALCSIVHGGKLKHFRIIQTLINTMLRNFIDGEPVGIWVIPSEVQEAHAQGGSQDA